jgi:OHCU decarboxylase
VRSYPADYELVAPGSLEAALAILSREPGMWLPIAGGTDVMVQYAAGQLSKRKLVSIWNLHELRGIRVAENQVCIGAACTYSDLRKHELVQREFPLLASAARWTGGIANQNRGTLGGNIVNASPAGDSLPALLVYETELVLVSLRGEHRISYSNFHVDYKKTQLQPDELIREICLPRLPEGYFSYARKVGTRSAQAISKVCIAALGRLGDGVVEEVRIALGSVAPVPLRLRQTEQIVKGKPISPSLLALAIKTAAAEVRPIDDIRSTEAYRAAVTGNLVADFLDQLGRSRSRMSEVLAGWNRLPAGNAAEHILPCCGSRAWAQGMAARRPFCDEASLLAAADETWRHLAVPDWMEAFSIHPRIGERKAPSPASVQSANWSAEEQRGVHASEDALKNALAEANREYERRFNRTFIVCATGKATQDILEILRRRLKNDEEAELYQAAEEQRQITRIRLKKWLAG